MFIVRLFALRSLANVVTHWSGWEMREMKKKSSRAHGNRKYAHGFNNYQWSVYRINPLFEHRN